MKNGKIILMILFSIIILSCNNISHLLENNITIVTIEVTRQITKEVYIYQSVTPSSTPTKKPTSTFTISPTFTITPTLSCIDMDLPQQALNACAWSLAKETKEELHKLVNEIAENISKNPAKRDAFLKYESEWEKLAENECWTWWGSLDDIGWYENGSMAPMLVGLCVKYKFEKRIEELKNMDNL
jgi:uncharacterized protein YecT (DUF1311 family)